VIRVPGAVRLLLFSFFLLAATSPSWAWGCKGHQGVALIAESHLTPHARETALSILKAVPIDPTLPRYCGASGLDPFADASTWPDDIRKLRPDTPPWHFIDIPRGAPKSDMAKYCPSQEGCVTSALTEQIRVLRDPKETPQAKADALRFVIHFVGDIHQPLHASTNNDLGGNCVPVTFFGQAPQEGAPGRRLVEPGGSVQNNPDSGSFHPNLHEVWDVEIIERFSSGESSQNLAKELDRKFSARMRAWQSRPADFSAWAWESHELAEKVAYGELPHRIPIAAPRPIASCADLSATERAGLLQLRENLADDYENAAAPVVQEQLAKAGARLASLINSIWP